MKARQPWQIKLTDDDFKPIWPTILLDWIEWQGPVQESWPPPAHQQIFFAGDGATKDLAYAREILSRFAARAYRRPVRPDEVDRLVKLFERSQAAGRQFRIVGQDRPAGGALLEQLSLSGRRLGRSPRRRVSTIGNWPRGCRISSGARCPTSGCWSWRDRATLHQPDVLRGEVRRMMHDPKIAAFADSFPRQWLQLRRVGMFEPDKKIYPDYDEYLEKSMVGGDDGVLPRGAGAESDAARVSRFRLDDAQRAAGQPLRHRRRRGRSAAARRAEAGGPSRRIAHAGVDSGPHLRRHAASAGPSRQVDAGVDLWQSAPAAAAERDGHQADAAERAEDHVAGEARSAPRAIANCAACHRKIDPLGLAFDNYDAIGHWRTEEAVRDGSGRESEDRCQRRVARRPQIRRRGRD